MSDDSENKETQDDSSEAEEAASETSASADDGPASDGAERSSDDADNSEADDASASPPAKKKKKRSGSRRGGKRRRRPQPKGSPSRNIVFFFTLVFGIAAAFGVFGNVNSGGGKGARPKWKIGQTVSISLTLVTRDYKGLACSMKDEVDGLYCKFESDSKVGKKSADSRKDKKLLQPYTTVDGTQLMAAGLWMQAPLKAKLDKENWDLQSPRFSVKCSYKVAGLAKRANIRWGPDKGWQSGKGWFIGTVSNCKME